MRNVERRGTLSRCRPVAPPVTIPPPAYEEQTQQGNLPLSTMSRRSRAREVVLQMLYRFDLNPDREPASDEIFIRKRLQHSSEVVDFALGLLHGVLRNRAELDAMLSERADNWSLQRMAATDRNVLRIGAYEILYSETPGRVAINEAVELARRFGSANSSQFVNGILDRFLQEWDTRGDV